MADFDQAIKINPNHPLAYVNRGNTYSGLGDKKGAIADYNKAIKINPNDANAYYNRGNAHYKLGDKKGAIQDFKQAANLYQQQGKQSYYQDALNSIKILQEN